jgi:hypothetical protein
MAITNTQGAFSVGRDCTLVLIDGSFGTIQLDNVIGFSCRQVTATVRVDRLDGVQLNGEIPKGWTGSFELERADAVLDTFFAQKEDAWFSTGVLSTATAYQYVAEADGSVTTLQFDNMGLRFSDAGTWQGDKSVRLRVEFNANRRRRV